MLKIDYAFDEIEIDDSHFQIDGVTDREKTFLNLKTLTKIKLPYMYIFDEEHPTLVEP